MKNLSLNKGRPSCLCIFIFAMLLSNPIYATELTFGSYAKQSQQQITGAVTDAAGPLPSVTVIVKGTTNSAVTDEKGNFSITANSTDVLVFSIIGYATQEIIVGNQTSIKIILSEDSTQLKEVTINAGYYKVRDKERTGSIAKITSKDIENQSVSNPLAAMQGRMSGVNITQSTGLPGGAFDIQIRGRNSIRTEGNAPLYIIDGVPYSSQSVMTTGLSGGIMPGTTSPLNSINPSDIEGIEVLKDADATAIYGSRGANGVVLITTKKGKAGATRFTVGSATTFGVVARKVNLMNTQQYIAMRDEAFANDGITEYPDWEYDVNGTWDRNRYTDWQDKLIGGTAQINTLQGSVSGGTVKTQFLLSGTFRDETTVIPGSSKYKKGSVHSSITHRSDNEKFSLIFSADYVSDNNALPGIDLTSEAYMLPPNAPALYDNEGKLNWENGTFNNPLGYLEAKFSAKTQNLISNAILAYKFNSAWELRTSVGYNDSRISEIRTAPSTMYNPSYGLTSANSSLAVSTGSRRSWIIEPQFNWNRKWDNLKLSALIGATFQEQNGEQLSQSGSGFVSNSLINNLAAATNRAVQSHILSEYRYNAFFARLNAVWADKYIVNVTGRRDGSSRFGPGNRFANFGAIGSAWIFSNEQFLKDNFTFLSFGKLRASYGITGNDQIGDYQFLDTYSVSTNNYNGIIGMVPTRLYNPQFGWESNRKFEAAIDLGFLHDNVSFSAAYFKNRSSNQLVGIPLPGTTGFPSILANLDAAVENTGVELELRTVNLKAKDFNWTTTVNLSVSKNKLVSFPGLEGSTYANSLVVGESLGIAKVYHYTGIDPQTGIYTFEDYNGDGIINASDRQYIADTAPEYFGGLGNKINYKSWELDFLFQFVKQQGRNFAYTALAPGLMVNQAAEVASHWPQDGTGAYSQMYTSGLNDDAINAADMFSNSSASISDASFVRLKSISLSWQIPENWSKAFTGKLYLQGQNLLTFTNYKGADPENRSGLYLPPLRQFTIGFQIGF
ncbi:SusC/RagA family TonB-linked outer membrane protein [Flavobacterium sp. '19STA2R22 D10 B1']|uniref:SusC/RagA family TonB-linked outer membrane protein n=1 Tax=Flavobacterium aerium TaxID=3037261 RepID=UPI00278BD01E|nr:SusC/RagA family TonB-linked outer membrane protein [Flavobacterium sp. '19STA2R22 D10 B1']